MKKIISILLLVVILLPSLSYLSIFAINSSDYTQDSILVDVRGNYAYVNVFVSEDGTILMPADILTFIGGLKRRTDGSEYVYSESGSSNTREIEREIRINKNGSYGRSVIQTESKGSLIGTYVNFKDSYTDDGYLYLPLEEIVPFLDAKMEITNDGILHIYPNPVSIFEALCYSDLSDMLDPDYEDDFYNVLFDLSDSNGCAGLSMFVDTIMGRLDRLDFIFDSGTINDYKALYKKMLVENEAYLSAFDKEETPYHTAFDGIVDSLKDAKKVVKIGEELSKDKSKSLDYITKSDKFDNYGEFSDFGDTVEVTGDIVNALYKIMDYANVLNKMVDDHYDMLYVVYGEGDVKKTPAGKAANEVADLYGKDTSKKIKSWGVSALRDYAVETIIDAATKKIAPYLVVCDAIREIIPGDLSGDYNQIYLADIVSDSREAFADYYNNISFNKESLNDLRLSLLMAMYSSKYGYDTSSMFDVTAYPDSTRSKKRITVNNWLEKLYLAADSVECCAPEYYSQMKKELSEDVKYLQSGGNANPDTSEASKGLEFTLGDDGKSYSVTDIGTCTDTDIVIPSKYNGKPVTKIGDFAFAPIDWEAEEVLPSSIRSVTIPNSITSIGEYAFAFCTSLEDIKIPSSVTYIGDYAFGGCESLTSIEIPDSVTTIDYFAFVACSSLEKITIPNSVTYMSRGVFADCISLTSIYYKGILAEWDSVSKSTDIPDQHWDSNTGDYTIYCTDGTISKSDGGANGEASEGLSVILNDDGVSYSVTGIGTCTDTDLVIPSEYEGYPVTSIGENAFGQWDSFTSVTIPDSVTSIDYGAFACVPSLTTVYFESNSQLTSIARYAFLGCDLLTNITIPESVTHIGYGAFCLCSSLESINIPDGVTYISEALFQECRSLKSITIPNSVKEIDDIAFWKCTSLESIYFNGTLSEWYAIEKSHYHGWNGYSGNYTVYCTDGTTSRGYNS